VPADSPEWHPRTPKQLDEEELADWRAGRNSVYQLAALAIGSRLAVADAGLMLAPREPGERHVESRSPGGRADNREHD
jgi:hypothetical protein